MPMPANIYFEYFQILFDGFFWVILKAFELGFWVVADIFQKKKNNSKYTYVKAKFQNINT